MAEFQQVDNKLLESKDQNEVVIALKPIHYDWFALGGHLNIPEGTLRGIAGKHNNDHFRQMSDLISTWISRPTREHRPSWRVLCQALAAMGKRELACKIAGIEEDDQPTSKSVNSACTGGIAVSHVAPTVEDLKVQLQDLTEWELFAIHLPGINHNDTTKISDDYHGTDKQKLQLYKVWLKKCEDCSWDHVITALKKNQHNALAKHIEEWLKTKPGRKVSSSKPKPTEAIAIKKKDTEPVQQPNGLEGTTAIKHDESTDGNGHLQELVTGLEDYESSDEEEGGANGSGGGTNQGKSQATILTIKTNEVNSTTTIPTAQVVTVNDVPTKTKTTSRQAATPTNIDWDLPSNDTPATTHITIDDPKYKPKGTVKWHRQRDSAKGGGDQRDHLVVVITNEYKGCDEGKGRLVGIKEDRKQLKKTFDRQSFTLFISEDTTKEEMKDTLEMSTEDFEKHRKPYKSVFIIFSGHGGMTKHKNPFILSEDCRHVDLGKLISNFEKKIGGDVPKFFLIDACKNVILDDLAKGAAGVNTLHAYATQDGEKAYMNRQTGSYWIQKVAKFFRSKRGTVVKVIEKANKEVASERINQKPVIKVNTLNAEGKSLSFAHIDYESSDEEDEGDGGGDSQGKSQDTLSAVKTENQSAEQTPQETNATPTGTLTKEPNNHETPTPKTKPAPPHRVQSTSNNILIGCLIAVIVALVGVIIAFVVALYFSKN